MTTRDETRLSVATNAAGWALYSNVATSILARGQLVLTEDELEVAGRVAKRVLDHLDGFDKFQETKVQKPSVGRIVHYVSYGTPGGEYTSQCRAAIIAETSEVAAKVNLVVLNPSGIFFNDDCWYSEELKGGTWHWPERVDQVEEPAPTPPQS